MLVVGDGEKGPQSRIYTRMYDLAAAGQARELRAHVQHTDTNDDADVIGMGSSKS